MVLILNQMGGEISGVVGGWGLLCLSDKERGESFSLATK